MSNNNGFYGNSTFGLTAVNTSSTYRNLTKIGSDTYPSHDDAKGSQNSQPHWYQPQNKLENSLYNNQTVTSFRIPETATSPLTALTATYDQWTKGSYVVIEAPAGASGASTPTTFYFNTQSETGDNFAMYTAFRKFHSIDQFHQDGGVGAWTYRNSYGFRVFVAVRPFSRICVFSGFDDNGEMILPEVFYNRWDSLLTAELCPPSDIPEGLGAECVDTWSFSWVFGNFGITEQGVDENFIDQYDKTFRGSQAWIYLPYGNETA